MLGKNKKIEFTNVWKRYGNVIALRNLNYAINENEFFVIFGPTGAGKTTTLKVIAGLELISAGNIHINGKDMTFQNPQNRNARLVFENYALYPHLTVFENIASPLRAKKVKPDEIQEMVKQTANLLGIGDYLSRFPRELSGGQKQRVALGRAIVMKSEIYLLDEPLAHLDAKIRNELRAEFHNIKSVLGSSTVIYVTHDYLEAMALGDRMAVLNEGVVEQIGEPKDVYNKPVNIFVANTIGLPGINLIKMDITRSDSSIYLANKDMQIKLHPDSAKVLEGYDKDEVTMGLRPQYFIFETKEQGSFNGFIKARVESFEFKNYMSIILVNAGDTEFTILSDTSDDIKVGEKIWIKPLEENILLFDVSTGKNLVNKN